MPRKAVLAILILVVLAVLVVLGVTAYQSGRPLRVRNAQQVRDLERAVRAHVLRWVREGQMARPDGSIKAVDVGQLLAYAARAGDREMYIPLRDFCVQHLIVNNPQEDYTRGMVLWRYKAGEQPDASGTTEALRIAQGLWRGAQQFGDPADRELALLIVYAYMRHQYVLDGVWLICNYYNLGTHAFATNTFTVDYDPDFLAQVAREVSDAELQRLLGKYFPRGPSDRAALTKAGLQDVAAKSYDLIRHCQTPAGLIYDLVQPEIGTLTDGSLIYFSPNDVGQLSNIAAVAERVSVGDPATGKRVLDFCLKRASGLNLYYYCRTGQVAHYHAPGCELYGPLVRMAVKLHDQKALDEFLPPLLKQATSFIQSPTGESLFLASEMLASLRAVGDQLEGTEHPEAAAPATVPATAPGPLVPPASDAGEVPH